MKLTDIVNGSWAITPEMLEEIQMIYATHMRGEKIDIAGAEARLGREIKNERRYLRIQDGIGHISLHGVMAKRANLFMDISGGVSTQIAASEFKEALADPEVKTILMDIDSPGGSVDGTEDLANLIRASRGTKPIIAFTDGMMASAAMWIGSAADQIFISSDSTEVGSIGVYARHLDYSKALENSGIKATEIKAGKYKAVGSPYKPLSDEDKEVIQNEVDYFYTNFVNSVADNRDLSVNEQEQWAEGRVFIGKQAIQAGLVDGVATHDSLVNSIASGELVTGMEAKKTGGVPVRTQTNKEDAMTLETLKAEHPDLYKAILKEGVASVDLKGEKEASYKEGAAAEVARVADVKAQSMPGFESEIDAMVADGTTTGAQAAQKIIGFQKGQMVQAKKDIAKDAGGVDVAEAATEAQGTGTVDPLANLEGEELFKAEFASRKDIRAEYVTEGSYVALRKRGEPCPAQKED